MKKAKTTSKVQKKAPAKPAAKKTVKKSAPKKEKVSKDTAALEEKIAWDILSQTDNESKTPEIRTSAISKAKKNAPGSNPVKMAESPPVEEIFVRPKKETKKKAAAQKTFKFSSIFFLLLAISVLMNVYFFLDASDMKAKALSNAGLAKKMIAENTSLKDDLLRIQEKYTALEANMKKYASDMRTMASGNIDSYKKLETDHTYELGSLYAKAGMYNNAIENFQKFLELNGPDAGAFYNLALLYEQATDNKREALKYYKKYLEINPEADDLYEITIRIDTLEKSIKQPEAL